MLTTLLDSLLHRLALGLIRFYRKHLSHRKGYRCAWGVHTGRGTCSTVGLRAFRKAGFFKGLALLRRQFRRCSQSARALTLARQRQTALAGQGDYRRLRPMALRHQAGFVDADCGDCGDFCSAGPGPDIFDCFKGAGKAFRACEMFPDDLSCSSDEDEDNRQKRKKAKGATDEQAEQARIAAAREAERMEIQNDIQLGVQDFRRANLAMEKVHEAARKEALKRQVQEGLGHFKQASLSKDSDKP